MAYRFEDQYECVLAKREVLRRQRAFSVPDEVGTRVAILVPFIADLVLDDRDNRDSFEEQTVLLTNQFSDRGRIPYHKMDATREDFAEALSDTSVATIVIAGFGNISAVACSLSKDRTHDKRFGYLDWLHLADMATHLKLGKFIMLQCGGYYRDFNPPLGCGVVSSHANLYGSPGVGRFATSYRDNDVPIVQLTSEDVLSYRIIRSKYSKQERKLARILPKPAKVVIRDVLERMNLREPEPDPELEPNLPEPVKMDVPDLRRYLTL